MAGCRCLTVFASAAALLLIAPSGTAWADPGGNNGHQHGKAHAHDHHHGQLHDADTSSSGDGLDPAVRLPGGTTDGSGVVTPRNGHGDERGHDHWTRRELANHPGKARGLFKHIDAQRRPDDPAQRPGQPAAPDAGNRPTPTQQHSGGGSAPQVNPPDTDPTDQPGSQPPPKQPPAAGPEQSLSRLLPRAVELRFTALPLLIMVGLAMCIGGLTRLARLRA